MTKLPNLPNFQVGEDGKSHKDRKEFKNFMGIPPLCFSVFLVADPAVDSSRVGVLVCGA
jgi:hypothetical protein